MSFHGEDFKWHPVSREPSIQIQSCHKLVKKRFIIVQKGGYFYKRTKDKNYLSTLEKYLDLIVKEQDQIPGGQTSSPNLKPGRWCLKRPGSCNPQIPDPSLLFP